MLEDAKDSLGLNFADLKFKEVHAGHLCMAKINTRSVQLADLKTGNMAMSIYDLKKAKKLTAEHKAMLKAKAENVPNTLKAGTWYDLKTSIVGDTLERDDRWQRGGLVFFRRHRASDQTAAAPVPSGQRGHRRHKNLCAQVVPVVGTEIKTSSDRRDAPYLPSRCSRM